MATTQIEFCKEAQEVLDKFGFKVSFLIDYGYDRRDFFPDTISYTISKDAEIIFNYSERGEQKKGRTGPDGEFGLEALNACLDCASRTRYLEQSRAFKRKLGELLDLRKNHKFSKFGEKKELKADCEKLCTYRHYGSFPTGEPTYSINVPLMEDNREALTEVLKQIENVKASMSKTTKKVEEEPENAGPSQG